MSEEDKVSFEDANAKSLWYCFDNSEVQIFNDISSAKSKKLSISFDMPSDLCNLDFHGTECVPHKGYKKQMLEKYAMLLTNQRRFISDKYSGDTPTVKESVITWIDFPLIPTM